MTVPEYSHDQEMLARELREVLAEFDKERLDREDIAEVLKWEAVQVEQGSKGNLTWLEGLGEKLE